MDIQCLFIAFIYEKCQMRILRSWQYLERASLRLQAYISRKRRRQDLFGDQGLDDQTLVHRLFWSCVKAEWFVTLIQAFYTSAAL